MYVNQFENANFLSFDENNPYPMGMPPGMMYDNNNMMMGMDPMQ